MDKNNYTIEEIQKAVNVFSAYDNSRGAYEYYKGLKKFIEDTELKEADPKLFGNYYSCLIKLKFLALNFFYDWQEIEELIKNHFELIYKIKYYDLWGKIKLNLLTVSDLSKRDKIKDELNKILLDCDRVIIDKKKYKGIEGLPMTVAEWLKDFIVNLGIGKIEHLKRVQYLTNSENIKKLDKEDKDKLKILFDFYEKLKISSNTPEGFESDIPMVINGKHIIYTEGRVEEIDPKVIDLIKSIKVRDEIVDDKEKEVGYSKQLSNQYPADSLEKKAIQEEKEKEDKIDELFKLVNQYPEGSLERKAIEEEINKIKGMK